MFRVCLLIVVYLIAGFSADDCLFDVKLAQYLVNEGFHRNITYRLEFHQDDTNQYNNCYVGLDQGLPPGVFANPDELGDFKRLQRLNAIPRNRVNIELPAEESLPTSVFIISKLTNGQASTWLPVHARYHHSTSEGGYARNDIEAPQLFLRCSDRRLEECENVPTITFVCNASSKARCNWTQIPYTVLTNTLLLEVPVGNTSAYPLVVTVTIFVIVAGSFYLLRTLHEYKIMSKRI